MTHGRWPSSRHDATRRPSSAHKAATCKGQPILSTNEDGAGHFRPGGDTQFEILHTAASGDLGYLVGIQHANVRMQGQDDAVALHLRITEIYRREDGDWKLIHRHADPHASRTDR